jgi:hypothetical protein
MARSKQNFSDIRINEFGEILNSEEEDSDDQSETDEDSHEDEEETRFKCNECDLTFTYSSGLEVHKRLTHTGTICATTGTIMKIS